MRWFLEVLLLLACQYQEEEIQTAQAALGEEAGHSSLGVFDSEVFQEKVGIKCEQTWHFPKGSYY